MVVKIKSKSQPDFELAFENYYKFENLEVFELDFDKLNGDAPEYKIFIPIIFLADYFNFEDYWWKNKNYLLVVYIQRKDYDYLKKLYQNEGIDLFKYYKMVFKIK